MLIRQHVKSSGINCLKPRLHYAQFLVPYHFFGSWTTQIGSPRPRNQKSGTGTNERSVNGALIA